MMIAQKNNVGRPICDRICQHGLLHRGNSTPFDRLFDAREQRCRHFEGLSTYAASIHRRVQPLRRRLAQLRGFAMLRAEETRCMSYVERVLQPGEQIRHISSIHWIVYWAGVGVALLAAVAYWLSETRPLTRFWLYTACALALVAVALLVQEWFRWWITEIAVTNRRVIYKKGFIRWRTNEMNMHKIESVQVYQSILGRMLGYGTVTILGAGAGFETLRTIAGPIELRNSITGT
jgi:membrane protein YdbS with pleckstrin-like domain